MKIKFSIALGIFLGVSCVFADESLRDLADERGRYIGAILNSEWFNNSLGSDLTAYETIHEGQFNAVVAENEMKFDATEPSQNSFSYTKGDKLITYAQQNGMRVRGHALAWHSQVPSWVSNGGFSKDELLAILKNHILNVVGHYKGDVHEWDVVNEAINDESTHGWRSSGSVWYETIGPEFIDSAFVWAHEADPDAELCYNDYALEWGTGSGTKAGFLLEKLDEWIAAGIPITCVGSQTHIQNTHTSTPSNTQALAKELAKRNIRFHITELDIGFELGTTQTDDDYAQQGQLYRQFMDVFLENSNMGEFMIWGVSDKYSWLDAQQNKTNGLLYDRSFNPKPAYDSLIASLNAHSVESVEPANFGQEVVYNPDASSGSSFGSATYLIVDYSEDATRGSWESDVEAGSPALSVTEFEEKLYMDIPLAGCDQGSCGYQHAVYTLPEDVVTNSILSKCENLVITMHGIDSTNYVNVGFNEPWKSLQYGNAAPASGWGVVSIPLDSVREYSAEPTQLTFNSNGSGIYIARIEAAGCPDDLTPISRIAKAKSLSISVSNRMVILGNQVSNVDVFDMQGRPVYNASNVMGAIKLDKLSAGKYMLRVRSGNSSVVNSIMIK